MADVSYTKTNVVLVSAVDVKERLAGEAIDAGEPVRIDPTDSTKVLLSQATTEADAKCVGIAIDSAEADQQVQYAKDQQVTYGAGTLTQGQIYCVSANEGKVCPYSDLVSTNYVTYLGTAVSTTTLDCYVHESDTAIP